MMSGKIEYYELVKKSHALGPIATAAIWSCSMCGNIISGMGGPGSGTICVECGDTINSRALLHDTVVNRAIWKAKIGGTE